MNVQVKGWDYLTIKDYFGLKDLMTDLIESKATANDISMEVAAYLCGVDVDTLYNARMSDVNRILAETKWAYTQFKPTAPKPTYVIDNERFNVVMDMRDCTTAQYIDYDIYSKDIKNNYARMLTCLLIPAGKKYGEGYDVEVLADKLWNTFPIKEAENIFYFFALASKRLFRNTLRSLTRKMKRLAKKEKNPVKKVKILRSIVLLNTQCQFIDGLDL